MSDLQDKARAAVNELATRGSNQPYLHNLESAALALQARQASSPMMTLHELAAYLKINASTVHRLLKRGELPGLRIGWRWRFNREQIDQWMREREMTRA